MSDVLVEEPRTKVCKLCNTSKDISKFHGNGYQPNGRKKYKPACNDCSNLKDHTQFYTRLTEALRNLGKDWECEECGYNKNLSAITFHHKDATKKSFEISKRRHASVTTFMGEISKCAVLCQNCHAEEHNPRLIKETVFNQCGIPL